MNPYEKLMARKRKWTPVQTTAGTCKTGAEEAIHRALALRHMELPVGDFITDALDKSVPDAARRLLESNVTDEENHDLALGYIANAYGVDEKAEKEALVLQKAWICSSREMSALTVRIPASPLKRKNGRRTKKIARSATIALRTV